MSKRMMMPQNKREEIIFCAMCVMFMCAIMLSYNMFLTMGFTFAAIQAACMAYPLTCAVCFCLDFFVVCPIVQRIMRKIGGPWMMKKPWLGPVIFQLFTVTFIVILESFYGAIVGHGLDSGIWMFWLEHIPLNAIVAYPVMILVCSPIIRFLFRLLIPAGQLKGNDQMQEATADC